MENEQKDLRVFEIISTLFAAIFCVTMFVKFLFF